ncbi:DUF3140 domain-containing protein [Mycolicibacterium arenosum]|uniref:DUF3140 domain-containing protein n=1 Tax=Mycolicibacterium arenosum TaxID=2952157 RepID=A0ABT1MD42_9MYCO|nr:DUF3140 domain-containing protein [Mycolicibacterium sp. CAU 1645]MCP9276802.1 DUF3140 domain-containing protein [Mycolicibacterium sp. CAU 1645]MCP9276825.1 DUF3140 domain-containing protein [Mycolicibacterium sp. CAU 1645]
MSDEDDQAVYAEFQDAVNMTPKQLEDWLDTDDSKSVGQKSGDGESAGHASGRRIVTILRTKKDDLSDDDVSHMRKVNGYVKRHLAQRPSGDVSDTPWRYSLMNWGHDPTK